MLLRLYLLSILHLAYNVTRQNMRITLAVFFPLIYILPAICLIETTVQNLMLLSVFLTSESFICAFSNFCTISNTPFNLLLHNIPSLEFVTIILLQSHIAIFFYFFICISGLSESAFRVIISNSTSSVYLLFVKIQLVSDEKHTAYHISKFS